MRSLRVFALLLAVVFLVACSRTPEPTVITQPATTAPILTTQPTEEETYSFPDDDVNWQFGPNVERNRFTVEDFGYRDGVFTCLTEPCMLGIDVSSYQESIDWQQVRDAGIEFVMIRIGGRGYGYEGNLFADSMANAHYQGAKEAGLKVGAYFFSQATEEAEALEEAQFALKLLEGWELDLPVAYDWEFISYEARTGYTDLYTVAMCSIVFCEEMKLAGYDPMVYFGLWYGYPFFELLMQYPVWIALYTEEMDYNYRFDMWQHSCTGNVPGVKGDVDLNIYFPPKTE